MLYCNYSHQSLIYSDIVTLCKPISGFVVPEYMQVDIHIYVCSGQFAYTMSRKVEEGDDDIVCGKNA